MAEVDYQHECDRAELLGLPQPDKSEFYSRQRQVTNEGNEEEIPRNDLDESVRREGFQRIGGGLEELNKILSSTQRKLNRFKTVCGSLSNLLKLQVGARREGNERPVEAEADDGGGAENQGRGNEALAVVSGSPAMQMKSEGNVELDKLDFLISRAEKAEMSLSSQNKQIKKLLN